jgi:predicted AAA+ superfamily ATPase
VALLKTLGWSESRPALSHYRTHTGQEVDLLLEHPDGRLVGIEVKASASPSASDFHGLKAFQSEYPERFHRGFVLHLSERATPFGDRLHALPVSALWRWA